MSEHEWTEAEAEAEAELATLRDLIAVIGEDEYHRRFDAVCNANTETINGVKAISLSALAEAMGVSRRTMALMMSGVSTIDPEMG